MGYSTYIIDYEELTDVKKGLDFVKDELSNAQYISSYVQTLIGNPEPDLKGAIGQFESSWNNNRDGLVKTAEELAEAVQKIIDDWQEWDASTATEFESNTTQSENEAASGSQGGPI